MHFELSGKGFLIFGFIIQLLFGCCNCEGKKCPGYCTSDIGGCKLHGGKILAYCKNGQACCNILVPDTFGGSCGEVRNVTMLPTYFKSPNYPKFASLDLMCEFKLQLDPTSPAVKVEFIDVEMDGMKYGGKTAGQCDSDMIYIKGFINWTPPPRCGNLTGYATIIDRFDSRAAKMKTLSIFAIMSSPKYKWLIRITQSSINDTTFNDNKKSKEPSESPPPFTSDSNGPINHVGAPDVLKESSTNSDQQEPFYFDDTSSETTENNDTHQMRNISKWHSSSVVNGKDTKIQLIPWQASLREKAFTPRAFENCTASEGSHFCGGSILDNRHILSAAHCFFGNSKLSTLPSISSLKVVLGDTNRCHDQPDDPKSTDFEVESIMYHYNYDDTTGGDDVIVIRLKEFIKFSQSVKSIQLAATGADFTGKEVLVSGWGLTNDSASAAPILPKVLQSTSNIFIENKNVCIAYYERLIDSPVTLIVTHPKYSLALESLLCAGPKPETPPAISGQGDSGGPIVVYKDKEPIQIGIVSYSIPAPERTEKSIDLYQSVSFYRRWIDFAMSIGSGL